MYNLARFDLVSIRLVVLCAQTGSLTKAAQDTNLAVAAASRRLRDLEDVLGSRLFERHARGLVVTPSGRVFIKHGMVILQTMVNLASELEDLQRGIAVHLRLCASTAAIDQFLPGLLVAHGKAHPGVHIELEEQVSAGAVSALRQGRADIGVFVEGPDTRDLETRLFRRDELVLVMAAGHSLASVRTPLQFVDALDEHWITLTEGASLLRQQQMAALASQRTFKLRMQVRSFDVVCHLVASGLGVALLPKRAVMPILRAMKLTWRPLVDEWADRRLLVAVVAGNTDVNVRAFVDFLAEPSQNANAIAQD
jgi:DNA-binding transcriptional LysR family regulator